jgi:hypothetical protein
MCTDRSVLQFAGPLVGLCCIMNLTMLEMSELMGGQTQIIYAIHPVRTWTYPSQELHVHCQQVGNGCRLNEKTTLPGFCL